MQNRSRLACAILEEVENTMISRSGTQRAIVSIVSVFCGVIVCTFVFIPGLSALFLMAQSLVPLGHLDASARLVFTLLVCSLLVAAAFGASGFIMGFIVSFFSKSREIGATLVSVVTVAVFYTVLQLLVPSFGDVKSLLPDPKRAEIVAAYCTAYQWLEAVLDTTLLIGFAILAASTVARRRRIEANAARARPNAQETEVV